MFGTFSDSISVLCADPSEGCLEYRGEDVKNLSVHWYRDQIGYVGQEPTLFNETIANNIAYGAPEASRDEIVEAAKAANAYDFIMVSTDQVAFFDATCVLP